MASATLPLETSQIGILTLLALPGTAYQLKRPIALQLERDEGGRVVVSEGSTGAFHYGQDLSQALAGFIDAFVEEYETLAARENSLSPSLASTLNCFRLILEPSASR